MALSRLLPLVLLAALALAACGHSGKTAPGRFAGAVFPPRLRAAGFRLPAASGKPVSLAGARGRVVVLAFLASGTRDATLAAQQVRGALDELGSRQARVSALLLASPDAPSRAATPKRFLRETALTGRAEYLAGPPARLRAVWKAYRIAPPSIGEPAFIGEPTVLLVDRQGFERVGFPLEQLTPEGLAHDIDILLSR